MNKCFLITVCTFFALLVNAQNKSDYLAGAVPEVDGKVVFTRSIAVTNPISDDNLYTIMDKWAKENYSEGREAGLTNRVLLSSPEDKDIACQGEEYLVFKKGALVLDRARLLYQLIIEIDRNKCDVTVRNIKYDYPDSKTLLPAEEMITDKYALNKKGDKLNRYYDKFRTHTVDSINAIFNKIDVYLNGKTTGGAVAVQQPAVVSAPVAPTPAPVQQATQPASEQKKVAEVKEVLSGTVISVEANTIAGFKKVSADRIPSSLLNKESLILTGTYDRPNALPASWGGTTTLLDKLMGLSVIKSSQTINNDQTYTISFYTEMYSDAVKELLGTTKGNVKDKIKSLGLTPVLTPSGAPAFSEAWMIIECKKAGEMPSSGTADKTYLGEIINVWTK
ncbi:hypothetical protein M2451_001017 [Dysgonomonas sp. PFB1-18]|uniref:DUF4468 domain-containing protein n=1 Tax=unclassified Dysgonomonas TaxID=2630389 RepID=UPI0024764162|nr:MULTISPECIES: DUF4468 domain-containing protein [unclassified Dysgonomonas]MDH6308360.1 hypothetical protein [Dysgonomonas sp. PF1-14]MDH6338203.1 hypothetical protein [Dysgonomonas sp. PF1-16]MDH6379700.1 hypothetical protein [Dysgonomonas sp. PFB1-18]MDH6397211.1 hypothetical protein [Dysgonomonas sp. PF1-23]